MAMHRFLAECHEVSMVLDVEMLPIDGVFVCLHSYACGNAHCVVFVVGYTVLLMAMRDKNTLLAHRITEVGARGVSV
jgi:hypothetical protein